jgi:diguanylate cyclase (GGDEF)-like protein/PAS domain S-box-containing protein
VNPRDKGEARLSAAFAKSPTAIALSRLDDGRFVDANDAFLEMHGYSRGELIGRSSRELQLWNRPEERDRMVAQLRRDGHVHNFALEYRTKSGQVGHVMGSTAIIDYDGEPHLLGFLADMSVLDKARQALVESEERFRHVFKVGTDAVFLVDGTSRCFLDANPAAQAMYGYSLDEFLAMNVAQVSAEPEATLAAIAAREAFVEVRWHRRKDGSTFPVEIAGSHFPLRDRTVHVFAIRDITERKRTEDELRLAAIAFESQTGIVVTDARGVIVRVNGAFSRISGYSAEEAVGRTPAMLGSGRQGKAFYEQMWTTLGETGSWQGEIWNRRKDGTLYAEWLTISCVRARDGSLSHYVGHFSDITQKKEADAEIHRLAYYDPLTRLPNRRLLHERVAHALVGCARTRQHGALMFLDLDHFKNLNDSRGHDVGDQLLVDAARRIQASVRTGDTVARIGGDEFVVMLEGVGVEDKEAAVHTDLIGEKIRCALAEPYPLDGQAFHCSASIGAVLFSGGSETVESLLRQADMAMYKAKSAGRNALRFFDPAMQTSLDDRSALEADLRYALERGQLDLHLQPQVDAAGCVLGAEALLRWMHPQRGPVAPEVFVPLAEETGLILPIGRHVVEWACARVAAWADRPELRNLHLAVNVSARQFRQPDFIAQIRRALLTSGADPARLKLELTETVVLDDVADTLEKMFDLKAMGVGFSLDDFGTGYSSLSYLTRLPLQELKIDRSFVLNLSNLPGDSVIAQSVITMGRSLGLRVVAEGVETRSQLDFLVDHGCGAFQGYFFCRPLPPGDFEAFVARASA